MALLGDVGVTDDRTQLQPYARFILEQTAHVKAIPVWDAVYTKCCAALQRSRAKGRQDFYLGHDGWLHDSDSQQNWSGNDNSFREIHINQHCEHFSAAEKPVWQSSAFVVPMTTLKTDRSPIGDDIEPIESLREDVDMGNDEDEEPSEAQISQNQNESEESNDKRNKNMKIQDMLCGEIGVQLV